MTLVVNGDVVAGTVWTLASTYRIRPAGAGLHAVSEVDPAQLRPLGEPIPRARQEDDLPRIESSAGSHLPSGDQIPVPDHTESAAQIGRM